MWNNEVRTYQLSYTIICIYICIYIHTHNSMYIYVYVYIQLYVYIYNILLNLQIQYEKKCCNVMMKLFNLWPVKGRCPRMKQNECIYHCLRAPALPDVCCVVTLPWMASRPRKKHSGTLLLSYKTGEFHSATAVPWIFWAHICKQIALHYKTVLCPKKKVNKFRTAEVSRGQESTMI